MSQAIRRALYRAKGLPDPGPTPSIEQTLLSVLVPRSMAKGIDELADLLAVHFPTRQDMLLALLEDGLRSAAQAAAEAEALKQEMAARPKDVEVAATTPVDRPALEIVNDALTPVEKEQISARLRALRGGDAAPAYGVRESAPEPSGDG